MPESLPQTVVTFSFFHPGDSLPYNEIETWCNRTVKTSKKGFMVRKGASDLIEGIMAAWDIVGCRGDFVQVTSWLLQVGGWKAASKTTKVMLNPQIHPLSGVNIETKFSSGMVQGRDITPQAKIGIMRSCSMIWCHAAPS